MTETLDVLDREWETINDSETARRTVRRWSQRHPALAGVDDLDDILIRRRDPRRQDEVLAALARLATDDTLAARTLLQALLPGLVSLAIRVGAGDRQVIPEVVSLAWERIRTYPTSRPGSVAANILWDVRKRYRQGRIGLNTVEDLPADELADTDETPDEVAIERSVFEELKAAQRDGLINDAARRLIIRTRVQGHTVPTVAAEEHRTVDALAQRRWRAEQTLRDHWTLPEAG